MSFYVETLKECVARYGVLPSDSVLVVAGGSYDRDSFLECGFTDVLISNMAPHAGVVDYAPFQWKREDVEQLSFPNDEFDWVFVHLGLHHCASPHRALCEMLRVSRKGIGVFEPRDSFVLGLAVKLGLVPRYEVEPQVLTDGRGAGVRDRAIPNHIYRWTERDVEKTVASFLPEYQHAIQYFYAWRIPEQRATMMASWTKRSLIRAAAYFAFFLRLILPRQGNEFAFLIAKEGPLQPWLKRSAEGPQFDQEWAQKRFRPENYIGGT